MDAEDNNELLHVFERLTPDFILNSIESLGFKCDGRILALNSYENRVYQIGIEGKQPLIAKFYRPNRWTKEQIIEEHKFCIELVEHELPVVPPIVIDGNTLFNFDLFNLALFERKGGHAPELDNNENLEILGRFLARIHVIGASKKFQNRPEISIENFGYESVDFILQNFIPDHIQKSYQVITSDLLESIKTIYSQFDPSDFIRTHGDCHVGNILWRNDIPHFVDFDDSRSAPAIQDIWMLLSGERENKTRQLDKIIQGYSGFYDFPFHQLQLIESLRTLRMLNYSAWLARRWDDPAFPLAFPWFNTTQYWEQQILDLREQLAELSEPALTLN